MLRIDPSVVISIICDAKVITLCYNNNIPTTYLSNINKIAALCTWSPKCNLRETFIPKREISDKIWKKQEKV